MLLFVLTFLAGDVWLQSFSHLPSLSLVFTLWLLAIISGWLLRRYAPYCIILPAFLSGIAWADFYAHSRLAFTLPKQLEGQAVLATGYIASLPDISYGQATFIFALTALQFNQQTLTTNTHIRLVWRHAPAIKVGDHWQCWVKLKRIHGTQNAGTFDVEAWALQKGLRATGYVVSTQRTQLLSSNKFRYPIDSLREWLRTKLQPRLPISATSPWLMALTMGERNHIAQQHWQVLRATGTNHLMAVAGLHIGIIAGMTHQAVSFAWRRVPALLLRLPAPLAAGWAALFVAWLYSLLAGFSLPTQRACFMLTILVLTMIARRQCYRWHVWSCALLLVLLLNPLSILTESFWLSFGTIALIIYGMSGRLRPTGYWWKWGRVQWVIGVGLLPLSLWLFQEASLVSFAANTIAIPWLAFSILPFCFFATLTAPFAPSVTGWLLQWADFSLTYLWKVLVWLSQWPAATWLQAMATPSILCLTVAACLWLLVPAGFPGRWLGMLWFFPLLCAQPSLPAAGDVWLTLLDVGQGLSIVVQTHTHTLVYDAGPALTPETDMGAQVVVPALRQMAITKVDKLIISHPDNDHLGGAKAVINAFSVNTLLSSVPDKMPMTSHYCLAGYHWQWDGVQFTFLYPTPEALALGNDSSCVLQIDNGTHQLLLTGDIEKLAESYLLAHSASSLHAEVIVAPHHGSKTSAIPAFIAAVHPRFVLYATGYRNRYHFPHPSVVKTYQALSSEQLNTAETGSQFFAINKQEMMPPVLYRRGHHRYWYDD